MLSYFVIMGAGPLIPIEKEEYLQAASDIIKPELRGDIDKPMTGFRDSCATYIALPTHVKI